MNAIDCAGPSSAGVDGPIDHFRSHSTHHFDPDQRDQIFVDSCHCHCCVQTVGRIGSRHGPHSPEGPVVEGVEDLLFLLDIV